MNDDEGSTISIKVAHGGLVPPMSTETVLVNSSAPGLTYFSTRPNLVKRRLFLVA